MRPIRLELHGFTAFRDPVAVDFDGADLFALVGPTGSGKSSLIDSMCFALYGSIPRLDRRAVAPVISVGKVEGRVRFDFAVGERRYTAARVVRRTSAGGATTKEARLECGGETLAGDADGVTRAVEALLGLGFEQFTKCVVLPQGEFARFLHDKPRDRQDLLAHLLGLDVYNRMRQLALRREATAGQTAELLTRQLEGLGDATDEALAAACERVERLERLRDELDATQPQLDALLKQRDEALDRQREATARAELLASLTAPAGVAGLAAALSDAERDAAAASDRGAAATRHAELAEAALTALQASGELQELARRHRRRRELGERIPEGERVVGERQGAAAEADAVLAEAKRGVATAREALEGRRRDHAAHVLAATLRPGEPCPVCLQQVAVVPERPVPGELTAAEKALADAEQQERRDGEAAIERRAAAAKAVQRLGDYREEAAHLDSELDGQPDAEATAGLLAERAAAEQHAEDARARERAARDAERDATTALDKTREQLTEAWTTFDAGRDRLAALGPPPADRSDLAAAWSSLITWANGQIPAQRTAAEEAESAAQRAQRDHGTLLDRLLGRCRDCELEVHGRRARDACADALARAEGERRRIAQAIERAAELHGQAATASAQASVARTLAAHLRADGFEQWLLAEALQRLVTGANAVLGDLSGGQYSLGIDRQRNFEVIDHRNADEPRPARTLSGGETFLASLALALTLAEHLAEMAAGSVQRLESIFLDEGFGALDPETLDVVAGALEELGAGGRTVGVVTHVRDLAERLPLRYEVRKGPAGSSVEQVVV